MYQGFFGQFFQMGYVTRDIHAASHMLVESQQAAIIDLIEEFKDRAGRPLPIRNLSHLRLGATEIELIEPRLDWPSLYLDALPDGEAAMGFHHIGYIHPDLDAWAAAMAEADAHGIAVAAQGGTDRARFAYLDTRAQNGHYTEVVWRAPREATAPT